MRSYTIIILLSAIVILSYIYNLLSRKTRIPSVLLLIATGIGIKYLSEYYGYIARDVSRLVKILGAIGLIMIVLEAALDLKIGKHKIRLIRDSFSSALFIFILSAAGIAMLLTQWLNEPFDQAFLYAIPLSIISSAVVIPSTSHLPEHKKEFIIYESSFSDIIGILVFNYMLMKNVLSATSVLMFAGKIGLAILVSIAASFMLIFILTRNAQMNIRFFLVFAVLSLVYAMGETIHIPSLLIVLVFGLVINNSSTAIPQSLRRRLKIEDMDNILVFMKAITAETSFLIRTFFFILFGYTINLYVFYNTDVWIIGTIIVAILLFVRFLYLRMILRTNLFPELFLMPRGLITILLFYSIPPAKSMGSFNEGILFFVIAITSILMMFGLLLFKDKEAYAETAEEVI
jgi:Kef-type K+ transport system membrane component KefB